MGSKSRNGLAACGFTAIAFVFIIIAFTTPCWLETDGTLEKPKLIRLGLWEVCLNEFQDTRHWYDTVFNSCWWIFEEEYGIIHDILLPGFFVATQFFFTLGFVLILIGCGMTLVYLLCCSPDHDKLHKLLAATGVTLMASALSGLIAIIIFGARGDGRDWMPDWRHNNLSWSFVLGAIGVICTFVAAFLYLVEAKRRYKRINFMKHANAAYHMEQTSA